MKTLYFFALIFYPFTFRGNFEDKDFLNSVVLWGVFIIWVIMGGAVRVAFLKEKKTFSRIFLIMSSAFFSSYVMYQFLMIKQWQEYAVIIIPITALLGEIIVSWLITHCPEYLKKIGAGIVESAIRKVDSKIQNYDDKKDSKK